MPKRNATEKVNLTLQYFKQATSFIDTIWDPTKTQMDRELNAQLLAMLMNSSVIVRNECLNNVFITHKSKYLKYLTSAGTLIFPLSPLVGTELNYDLATATCGAPIPDSVALHSMVMLKYKSESLSPTELSKHLAILSLTADRIYVAPFLLNFYNQNPESAHYDPAIATKIALTCYHRISTLSDTYKSVSSHILLFSLHHYFNALIEKTDGMQLWKTINPDDIMPLLLQLEQCLSDNMSINSKQAYCVAYLTYQLMPAELYQQHLGELPLIKATRLLGKGAEMDEPGCIVHLLYNHCSGTFKITEAKELEHYLQQAYALTTEDISYLNDKALNKFLLELKLGYEQYLADNLKQIENNDKGTLPKKRNIQSAKQAQIEAQRKIDQELIDGQLNKTTIQQKQLEMTERARNEALLMKTAQATAYAEAQANRDAAVEALLAMPFAHNIRTDLPNNRYRHNPYSIKALLVM